MSIVSTPPIHLRGLLRKEFDNLSKTIFENYKKKVDTLCAGAFLLAEAGVIDTQKVTTHWEDIPDLKTRYPQLEVLENQRWVDEGTVIISGGILASIDMSLNLVSKTHGLALAQKTAKQMEFDWTKNT